MHKRFVSAGKHANAFKGSRGERGGGGGIGIENHCPPLSLPRESWLCGPESSLL